MIVLEAVNKSFRIPRQQCRTLRQHVLAGWRRRWDRLEVIDNLDLEVPAGQFLGVIGRNGSGKSTLLKLMAQVLEPTRGRVRLAGPVAPFLELGVGFQGDLSVRDNIVLTSALLGQGPKQTRRRMDWILDFAELRSSQDRLFKNLSSGMQVRLAFSVTVSTDRPILLVDEVLAVGDLAFQEKCFEAFRRAKQSGRTVVFVSHDLEAVRSFCDRVIWLDQGRVAAQGRPDEVIEAYQEAVCHGMGAGV